MAKCNKCGRKGLFFKVNSNGLCSDCAISYNINSEPLNKLPELQPFPHTSIFRYDDNEVPPAHHADALNIQLQRARSNNIDYVDVVSDSCCCSECAKYRNRVYCLSGKDKRFPKFPKYVQKYVSHCGFSVYPFIPGVNFVRLSENKSLHEINEIISYSNRPFTDDRSREEIEKYGNLVENRKQEYINKINSKQSNTEYEQILKTLPEIAPKSPSGYLRMKKANSTNFQKLVCRAREAGIEIRDLITEINK